ncbi:MAG: nuclear transport factor 2 family protein [Saprospiraceae bacterium]|nr:nuclear transport factor 2 family protein [Saprospiraceae bacterium]
MIKKFLLPAFLLLHFSTQAQTVKDEQAAVIATIQRMFDAMRAGDSTLLRSTFDPSARMQTAITNKEGKPMLLDETVGEFAKAVGTPHTEVWDERIWHYDVRVDGRLATAWTDYTFYLDEKMLHCGVNAFQLFKGENGWKITQITDTRRKTDCQTEANPDLAAIHKLMDAWHHAAAVADEDTFFGSMTPDGIYLGTDASERWLRDEMKEWSKSILRRKAHGRSRHTTVRFIFQPTAKWRGSRNCWTLGWGLAVAAGCCKRPMKAGKSTTTTSPWQCRTTW